MKLDDVLINEAVEKAAAAAGAADSLGKEIFKNVTKTFAGGIAGGAAKHVVDSFTRPSLLSQVFGSRGMLPKALVFGGTAAGLAAGSEAAERYYEKKRRSPQKLQENIGKMFAEFPDMASADPVDVRHSMRTLQTFNPKAAADPLAAKSWVQKYLAFKDEGVHPTDLKTLAEAGRNLKEINKGGTPVTRAFEDATRFLD